MTRSVAFRQGLHCLSKNSLRGVPYVDQPFSLLANCRMSPYRDTAYQLITLILNLGVSRQINPEIVTGRNRSKSILQQHRIISIDGICRYFAM